MPEPLVEMLWEARDPHDALATRFGFGGGQSACRWVAATLRQYWGIRLDSCERIVLSNHNALAWVETPVGRLLAKWSAVPERFAQLAELARLTSWLDGRDLPVSAPLPALDGRLQVEANGASLGMQRVVEGDLLDPADPDQVRAAGATLARLQDALATYPRTELLAAPVEPLHPLPQRIARWLDSYAGHLPTAARDALRRRLADAPGDTASADTAPTQLLHYDYRSANVLCRGPEVAAVLDFEQARLDHRIVELARSAVVLGTRYRDWGPVSPAVHEGFRAGYESVRPLTVAESAWWPAVLLWQALLAVPAGEDPTGWMAAALSLI
ncbi:MAG TPA: phosphotransferase [Jatrophihabitans sp.]|nr:phosphotransferase [Jatrophihabitans sp.]